MFAKASQAIAAPIIGLCIYFQSVLFFSVCRADPGIDPNAQVYAFIIGVEKYGPNKPTASKAADGAKRFAAAVRETYGDAAVKCLLIDEEATYNATRSVLHEMKKVPAGSLVITYFAGHGVRESYDQGSTLYLRLYGSSATDYLNNSIEAKNLWEGLAYTKYTNAMIFLDCCYSGSDETDIVADVELNNANIRAFLMCSCAQNEQATGDIFTSAILEEWKNARQPNGRCIRLDEFEDAVRTRVRQRDKGYMTPGIAFKTKIARCVTQMSGPSAILTFTFPRGCKAGLTFLFDDRVIEQGFQYTKDLFFVCQVSLDHPLKVLIKGPGNANVAGPMVIDPRQYQPRRIIPVEIDVPAQFAIGSNVGALQEAIAYQKVAEIVEAYGEPPQEFYVKAAEKAHRVARLGDTNWLLRKAAKYEPQNDVYALMAGVRPPSETLLSLCSANPSYAVNTINRLEKVGAYAAAGELGWRVVQRLPQANQTQRNVLLARAIGNFKLGNKPEREQESQQLLATFTPGLPIESLTTAFVDMPAEGLAAVWDDLPMSDLQWAYFQNGETNAVRKHIFSALTAETDTKLERAVRLATARAQSAATLGSAERLLYTAASGGYTGDVIAESLFVNPGNTIPSESYALQSATIEYGATRLKLLAPTQYDAVSFLVARPGFNTKCDSRTCTISAQEPVEDDNKPVRFRGPVGYEFTADCLGTAIGYKTSKVGFVAEYDNAKNINVIRYVGDDVSTWDASPYLEKDVAEFGEWRNAFKDLESALKYKKATAGPTLIDIDATTGPFKLETTNRQKAARQSE